MAGMTKGEQPVRVAIVGGGCAALTTAFELTRPEHEAATRSPSTRWAGGSAARERRGRGVADRIEEHGLHLWMGFYENAFRLMRECYAERHAMHPELPLRRLAGRVRAGARRRRCRSDLDGLGVLAGAFPPWTG